MSIVRWVGVGLSLAGGLVSLILGEWWGVFAGLFAALVVYMAYLPIVALMWLVEAACQPPTNGERSGVATPRPTTSAVRDVPSVASGQAGRSEEDRGRPEEPSETGASILTYLAEVGATADGEQWASVSDVAKGLGFQSLVQPRRELSRLRDAGHVVEGDQGYQRSG